MAELKMNIANCAELLANTHKAYEAAKSKSDQAGRELTDATNSLNDAQKRMDEAVSELKKEAPWNTKWHGELNPARSIAA